MKHSDRMAYSLVAFIAIAPVGVRALLWQKARQQPVEPAMAQTGQILFLHEWKPRDPLAAGGDGLGPVFNATSCVACHHQAGVGGGGGLEHNVTMFTVRAARPGEKPRQGVVHAFAVKYQETLAQVDPNLPAISRPTLQQVVDVSNPRNRVSQGCSVDSVPTPRVRARLPFVNGVELSQRNTPALFGAKLIDELSEREIIAGEKKQRLRAGLATADSETVPVGRALRLADGRVGRFGWKAQTATLAEFVQAACANELGLGNPGQAQPRPLGQPNYRAPGPDLTIAQCDQLTAFIASLSRPVERLPKAPAAAEEARQGKRLFQTIGCADCHTPDLGSAEGIYSDLLLHRMGAPLVGGGSYNEPPPDLPNTPPDQGPRADEWRTPPLWGVADSAPYLHDGRAATLQDAIRLHGGQGANAAEHFTKLNPADQVRLIAFLQTLRAP
ncbi:MAG TPA: di-heme oxidoredictase family protein [Gemmataceae bacterium]|nr:di-heme oxidoredictase family protein [Gemmataceae bacterium]